jgi:hypothetical protein
LLARPPPPRQHIDFIQQNISAQKFSRVFCMGVLSEIKSSAHFLWIRLCAIKQSVWQVLDLSGIYLAAQLSGSRHN